MKRLVFLIPALVLGGLLSAQELIRNVSCSDGKIDFVTEGASTKLLLFKNGICFFEGTFGPGRHILYPSSDFKADLSELSAESAISYEKDNSFQSFTIDNKDIRSFTFAGGRLRYLADDKLVTRDPDGKELPPEIPVTIKRDKGFVLWNKQQVKGIRKNTGFYFSKDGMVIRQASKFDTLQFWKKDETLRFYPKAIGNDRQLAIRDNALYASDCYGSGRDLQIYLAPQGNSRSLVSVAFGRIGGNRLLAILPCTNGIVYYLDYQPVNTAANPEDACPYTLHPAYSAGSRVFAMSHIPLRGADKVRTGAVSEDGSLLYLLHQDGAVTRWKKTVTKTWKGTDAK